jgi:hypothetical protein
MATVTITEHTKSGTKTYEVDVTDAPAGFFKCFKSASDFHDGPPGNNHWTVSGDRNPRNPREGAMHELSGFDID